MKLITQIRYGVRILLDLAMNQHNGVVRMGEIAARQQASSKYLEQLIQRFKKAGLVKSTRGRHGGYYLAGQPESITLAQIIRVFEKENPAVETGEIAAGYSQYQDDLIQEAWDEAKAAFYGRLDQVSLADLSIDTTKKLWQDANMLIL